MLHRVQLTTDSANQSLKTSRVPSRAPSPHAIEREDTPSIMSAATTDVDAKTTISLDTQVSTGGTNFSQGQRQLIAMAWALLRRSSIIVLWENSVAVMTLYLPLCLPILNPPATIFSARRNIVKYGATISLWTLWDRRSVILTNTVLTLWRLGWRVPMRLDLKWRIKCIRWKLWWRWMVSTHRLPLFYPNVLWVS